MPMIPWDDKIALDIKSIDAQHRYWIGLINDLYDAMKEGKGKDIASKILTSMFTYTRTHFAYEEGVLSNNGYPEYAAHKALHDAFIQKITDLQQRQKSAGTTMTLEVLDSLKDWLVNHIQSVDRKYAAFLKEKGVE